MKLISVNVSLPKDIQHNGRTVRTGIFKEPINKQTMLRELNLDGDGQADLIGHGGPFKAVYAYSIENYNYWKKELDREDFTMGQFGENFTVEGMPDDQIHVGDVFRVGGALVEVTQPRVPCSKLGLRMGFSKFPKMFLQSCRVGFYLRVLEEGEVAAGDEVEQTKTDPAQMSVREICHLLYFDSKNIEGARKALCIPALSPSWKGAFEERLSKAGVAIEQIKVAEKGEGCCAP